MPLYVRKFQRDKMAQLTRIGELIGSFVSRDYKRKRLHSHSDEDVESPVKKTKNDYGTIVNSNSLSAPAFLQRVSTFTDFIWCRDIPALSPLEISRHGWFSTKDEFMVRCASCQENLNLTVPAPSSGIRESCIVTAVERLVSAHAEFCPWAASPNPIDWTRAQVPDLTAVASKALEISTLGLKLPFIKSDVKDAWCISLRQLRSEALEDIEDEQVRETSCILALCGWRLGLVEDTLQDGYGIRRIGVWNFVSIVEEEDALEARRVAEELGQTIQEKRTDTPGGKKYFNPLTEHVSWNPLLQKRDGLPGWRYIIGQVNRKLITTEMGDSGSKVAKDSFSVLRKVRDLIDHW
ncbi:nuclear-interacting partner of ALK [Eurytemora carolleeae]|uniref:nuclear-interacting partner of ALK n=1 Tax=Eurytemora carolleeae TaxID=1294199 RepID=UPI000C7852CC|nr:nuclear-interacting partner of ALK [Eurytemora carolleeae]|eukprot:XP_023342821.1 nuclear-interacting partner of ALK-like [Eurytemora affinis]